LTDVPIRKDNSLGTVYLLKRAELAVRNCAEVALAPFGLTPTQFLVLFRLEQSKGVSSAELARVTGVRPQSVAELIGPLERRGLISRREAAEHRRILRISLSAAGEQLLGRATPVARQLEKDLLANLAGPQLTRLREGLLKLLANAEAHETNPMMRRSAAMRAEVARPRERSSRAQMRKSRVNPP
jgi:DNA-binding MarR family transcriptional regulator